MQINENVKIVVAEPWDFTSEEGDNVFSGKVSEITSMNSNEAYLIKCSFPFVLNNIIVKYVVATYRNKKVDSKVVNIAYIPDEAIDQFSNLGSIINEMKFIMIGRLE